MTFVETKNGGRLWFEVRRGSSHAGFPLLLIQGRALDHHGWDSAREDFQDRTTIVFDHRGTGLSTSSFTPGWSARDFAADIVEILDGAGFKRVHVYGHSMGGRIAQWLGAEHADRVVSLVLGGTSVGDERGLPRPAGAVSALASGDPQALAALFYPDAWIAANPDKVFSVLPAPASPEAARVHGAASDRRDGPRLESIRTPTLIVHGTDDRLADPENAEILGRHIPHATTLVVPGARHAYWIGDPAPHLQVREFLAAHDDD